MCSGTPCTPELSKQARSYGTHKVMLDRKPPLSTCDAYCGPSLPPRIFWLEHPAVAWRYMDIKLLILCLLITASLLYACYKRYRQASSHT